MTSFAVAVYRVLMLMLPLGFRREHSTEIEALFRRSLLEGRSGSFGRRIGLGWLGVLQVAAAEWTDVFCGRTRMNQSNDNGGYNTGGAGMMETTLMAARQALRSVLRAPAISLGVVGLLGLGIGATVTVLSVVDGVLMRPQPYPDSDRLVLIDQGAHSWPDFLDWRENVQVLDGLVAGSGFTFTLTTEVQQHVEGARVSGGFFELFGATVARGRLPSKGEFEVGRQLAVVSHSAWLRRWGGDPNIVGRVLTINGGPVEVIGVLSSGFVAPRPITGFADIYLPADVSGRGEWTRHDRSWTVIGRLSADATIQQARDALYVRAEAIAEIEPELYLDDDGALRRTFPPITLQEAVSGDARAPLLILLVGAGLLMLVAIGNAASLFLARGEARQGELAVRRALGAGASIRHQLLIESLILSALAGLLGLASAVGGLRLIQLFEPGDLPRIGDLAIDGRIAAMALVLALVAGLTAGLIPALQAGRVAPGSTLRRAGTGARGGMASRSGRGLVVVEAALATLLLVGSLTVVQGMRVLLTNDPGFDASQTYMASIDVGIDASEEERVATTQGIRARLLDMPGVVSVGAGATVPFQISGGKRCCWVGSLRFVGAENDRAWVHPITNGYFSALGATFAAGREFESGERSEGDAVVILNQMAANELEFATTDVGESVFFGNQELRVVGIVNDIRHWGADQDVEAEYYLPQDPQGAWASEMTFLVRGVATPSIESIASAVADVETSAIVTEVRSMNALMSESLSRQRFYSMVLSVFATLALVLAMAGLSGTLLYDVRQRTRELGIRVALGATAGQMARGVLLRGLFTVGIGGALGLIAYWPLRRYAESVVPGVDAVDPMALAGFGALMFLAVLIASWLPARVVASTDPAGALRGEG